MSLRGVNHTRCQMNVSSTFIISKRLRTNKPSEVVRKTGVWLKPSRSLPYKIRKADPRSKLWLLSILSLHHADPEVNLQLLLTESCKKLRAQFERPSVQELKRTSGLKSRRICHTMQSSGEL